MNTQSSYRGLKNLAKQGSLAIMLLASGLLSAAEQPQPPAVPEAPRAADEGGVRPRRIQGLRRMPIFQLLREFDTLQLQWTAAEQAGDLSAEAEFADLQNQVIRQIERKIFPEFRHMELIPGARLQASMFGPT